MGGFSETEPTLDSVPPSIPSAARATTPGAIPTQPIVPGQVVARRYEVLSVLGEGGMGIVYRCRDQSSGDFVALKRVVLPEGKMAADYIGWFCKEARALAALDHPGIVHARDFGQLGDGSPFLAMDLVSGTSLHDLSHTRVPWPDIWAIVDQVLGALAHAHSRGVVHGDLKPSNVLVDRRSGQQPKVHILDFGLAWLKADLHDERLDGAKPMEFTPHAGAGTPGYMAPEQIQHEMHHVCGATDLYALGCILYKLVTSRAPFSGDPKELLRLHAYHEPPEPRLVAEVPPAAKAFVQRLLQKRPWDRWEFANAARREWQALMPPGGASDVLDFPSMERPERGLVSARLAPQAEVTPPLILEPALERSPGLMSIRPSPLVGRGEVRSLLRGICEDVIAGRGSPHRLVLLLGPGGVGKSRIAEWLCETVHEDGRLVPLTMRYRKVRTSLDGMLGAVTTYLNFERADRNAIERSLLARWSVDKNDHRGRSWVAGAAEWLRPSPLDHDIPVGPSGLHFTLDTLALRRLVTQYTIRRLAGGRPLLLFLDDLHHASESTYEGLLQIHRDEMDQPIVFVATVRTEDVHLGTPAAERLRHLREVMDGTVVEVNPMDRDTTCAMLRASLPLDDDAVLEAARRSRGYPLFALQQLHAWAHSGDLEYLGGCYRVPEKVLGVRPSTTAELWDSRIAAVPRLHRLGAYAIATLGQDLRVDVVMALLGDLHIPAEAALASLQRAEILLPRGPGRYSWPHALLQEHLVARVLERDDAQRMFRASARALRRHPLANTRRIVRQRVVNLLHAREPDAAAETFFDFLQHSWNGAREPAPTLADLDLLAGHLEGRSLALEQRWRAEALRHVGQVEEATRIAEVARASFERLGDEENHAHCLRLLGHLASEQGDTTEGLRLVGYAHQIFTRLDNTLGLAQCEAVIGWIEYLLGNHDNARRIASNGERHFAQLEQHLGQGQCLLVLSWVDHHEGWTGRSRRRIMEARQQFEQAGYRLGIAQTDASLAHIEHRLHNYFSAAQRAREALAAFETLRTLRGQAECERLLAMIRLDTDDVDKARVHAERATKLYSQMGDPWGLVEAQLLSAQIALAERDLAAARKLLRTVSETAIREPEPRQHALLTEAWLCHITGDAQEALRAVESAERVFDERTRVGDHTPHLLARLIHLGVEGTLRERVESWRTLVEDRSRRETD